MAVGVYQAVRRAGLRVPEDVSIVGYDDSPMATHIWPMLTTVKLPIRLMGRTAAQLLVSNHDRAAMDPPQTTLVVPEPDRSRLDRRTTGPVIFSVISGPGGFSRKFA